MIPRADERPRAETESAVDTLAPRPEDIEAEVASHRPGGRDGRALRQEERHRHLTEAIAGLRRAQQDRPGGLLDADKDPEAEKRFVASVLSLPAGRKQRWTIMNNCVRRMLSMHGDGAPTPTEKLVLHELADATGLDARHWYGAAAQMAVLIGLGGGKVEGKHGDGYRRNTTLEAVKGLAAKGLIVLLKKGTRFYAIPAVTEADASGESRDAVFAVKSQIVEAHLASPLETIALAINGKIDPAEIRGGQPETDEAGPEVDPSEIRRGQNLTPPQFGGGNKLTPPDFGAITRARELGVQQERIQGSGVQGADAPAHSDCEATAVEQREDSAATAASDIEVVDLEPIPSAEAERMTAVLEGTIEKVKPERRPSRKRQTAFDRQLFGPTDLAYAIGHGLSEMRARQEFANFRDYHLSKGSTFADWHAAWRKWVRNAVKWNREPVRSGRSGPSMRDFINDL